MSFQQIRMGDEIQKVSVYVIEGVSCVLLEDVNIFFPNVKALLLNGVQLPFLRDAQGCLKSPVRIDARPNDVLDGFEISHTSEHGKVQHNLEDILSDIRHNMKHIHITQNEILKNTTELLQKVEAILTEIYQLAEYTVPRIFIILPEKYCKWNPSNWVRSHFRLYFLCECKNENIHFALHEGYAIKQPRKFFIKYGPHLIKALTIVKGVIQMGGFFFPVLGYVGHNLEVPEFLEDKEFWESFSSNLEKMIELLNKFRTEEMMSSLYYEASDGIELRELKQFLKRFDDRETLGNLYRGTNSKGEVKWLCKYHYNEIYGKKEMEEFLRKFTAWGGWFDHKTGEARLKKALLNSSDVQMFCDLIRSGFNIYKLTLYKCIVNKSDLLMMVDIIQKSFIKEFELLNLLVIKPFGNFRKSVDVVELLENCIQQNGNVKIIYNIRDESWLRVTDDDVKLIGKVLRLDDRINLAVNINMRSWGRFFFKTKEQLIIQLQHVTSEILQMLAEALESNKTITKVDLSDNKLENNASFLYNCLIKNNTIIELHLNENKLGDNGISFIAKCLKYNNAITAVHIECNEISNSGAKQLALMLGINQTLCSLNLSGNKIGDDGAIDLANSLKVNQTLTSLDLYNNNISSRGMQALIEALQGNNSLTILDLSHNEIYDFVGRNYKENTTLRCLNLAFNRISDNITLSLTELLKGNSVLKRLNLLSNEVSNDGAEALADVLLQNDTLIELNLSHNKISDRGARALARTLKKNNTLKIFLLGNNRIATSGVQDILEALKSNQSITEFDIGSNEFSLECAKYLADLLKANHVLRSVDVSGNSIKDDEIEIIMFVLKSTCRTLAALRINQNKISDSGATAIGEMLAENSTLTSLNLSANRITDIGLRYIAEGLLENKSLVLLDLRENQITEGSYDILAELRKANNMIQIEL